MENVREFLKGREGLLERDLDAMAEGWDPEIDPWSSYVFRGYMEAHPDADEELAVGGLLEVLGYEI